MAPVNDLLSLAQTGQALALVSHNVGTAKKKKIGTKDIVGLGVGNIVGTSMIRAQGSIASLV